MTLLPVVPRTIEEPSGNAATDFPLIPTVAGHCGVVGTVVEVLVVVVAEARVIVVVVVFAGYLPDFAIFNVNVHEPVEPIVNVVGLLFGVNVHEPFFDQVFTPDEFVLATADKLLT